MEGKGTLQTLEDIQEYITNLRFKTAVVGGVDRSEALVAIREVYDSFSKLHGVALINLDSKEKKIALQDTQIQEQDEIHHKQLADIESNLRQTIQTELSEELERRMSYRTSELEQELSANKRKAENAESAFREMDKQAADLNVLVIELKDKLTESEHLRNQQEEHYRRELELAKAGSAAEDETLQEIFVDAREQRKNTIAQAEQEAEDILKNAAAEAEALLEQQNMALTEERRRAEAQIAEIQREAELAMKAAEKDLLEQENQRKQMQAEAQRELDNAEAEVERKLEAAQAEAQRILENAKEDYKAECESYLTQIQLLSGLRSKVVRDMQDAVNKLNSLAFEMSGGSIKSDSEYLLGVKEAAPLFKQMDELAAESGTL